MEATKAIWKVKEATEATAARHELQDILARVLVMSTAGDSSLLARKRPGGGQALE